MGRGHKVAIVAMQFPTPSETFLSREIRALRARDMEVAVYTLKGGHALGARLASEQGVGDVATFPAPGRGRRLWSALASVGLKRLLDAAGLTVTDRSLSLAVRFRYLAAIPGAAICAARLIDHRPDVVHLYWGHYPSLVLHLLAGRLPHCRYTMFLGAYDLMRAGRLTREVSRSCAAVFTHAEANVALVREHVADVPVRVNYRGIDLDGFPSRWSEAPDKDPHRIVAAGRIVRSKRFDLVLDAFAMVRRRIPEARLDIAGDGPALSGLRERAERLALGEDVRFHGRLSEERLRQLMLSAKAFLLLSEKEGECLPNVVKEAMAAGCVCIASRTRGIDELISHEFDGYIIENAENPEAAAGRLLTHLGRAGFEEIQQRAAARIRTQFDVSETVSGYLEAWGAPSS